jgi:threonine synthase
LIVYFFHPRSTLYKLDAANFAGDRVKVITVDRPEREVKRLAKEFADTYGITHVPNLDWRFAASAVRAMHIMERSLLPGRRVDWMAQTICAGFGPVGIYDCWSWLIGKKLMPADMVPSFLGIQQAANAPIVRAWEKGSRRITEQDIVANSLESYIEPGLYNTNPNINYANLNDLNERYGGAFLAVEGDDYSTYEQTVINWFRDAGLEFTRMPQSGEILERAGILTGVGILKAIEVGVLEQGSRVLYLLTGGFRKLSSFNRLQPDVEVDGEKSIAGWIQQLGRQFGLRSRWNELTPAANPVAPERIHARKGL